MTLKSTKLLITLTFIGLGFAANSQSKQDNINFTKFDVSVKNQKVAIDFSTDKSLETNYFEIQKSVDGINFHTIALILGPDPKQHDCDCYGYSEKLDSKNAKQSYYRAKHISADGAAQYSEPRLLTRS